MPARLQFPRNLTVAAKPRLKVPVDSLRRPFVDNQLYRLYESCQARDSISPVLLLPASPL